ncbi:LysE/ArgO family amino acid transporter [Corynebacterium alimapuense]|uniref:Lysine transporter LysE n=1 Tax=Corynebacterium alimapuense TaxID=1576874 RepID=A0A3M8K553_9CORY|nr:LysE/ArgO family amino acid transporter [Corynebacterium alimapuense]RNE48357.1 lysine transporter LysE [Corynebacterium alimapuense]
MSIVLAGLLLGFSLIVAIGPQNILLIRQGARREGVTAVIIVCLISDVLLLSLGTLGVGVLVAKAPLVLVVLKWAGVAYLAWFSLAALKDAARAHQREGSTAIESSEPQSADLGTGSTAIATRQDTKVVPQRSWVRPMWQAIALTWLNPAAYLDSLVMIGGIASQYGEQGRWLFTGGALLASFIWFPVVGYGAGLLSGPLSNPKVWRVLNVIIAIILAGLALKLALM